MATVTRAQLISQTRQFMDAENSSRWDNTIVLSVLNSVYDDEWTNLLNAAPYYTFATRTITTDSAGQVPFSSLSSGSGDSQQNFYRILSLTDGNIVYEQTRFQDVPVATTSNYLPTYPRMYYLVGTTIQILPVAANVTLYASVNWTPTALSDLSSDAVTINWPENSWLLLCYFAAAKLLLKGGAESAAAAQLRKLGEEDRAALLDNIRRRTINPTRLAYSDQKYDWAGG